MGVAATQGIISKEAYGLLQRGNTITLLAYMDNTGCPRFKVVPSLKGISDTEISVRLAAEKHGDYAFGLYPEAAFLVLSSDLRWMRGAMHYTRCEDAGEAGREIFFDLISIEEERKLTAQMILLGRLMSRLKAVFAAGGGRCALAGERAALFSESGINRFICWVENGRLSDIVPVPQAIFNGKDQVIFSALPYGEDFTEASIGANAAVLCVNSAKNRVMLTGGIISKGVFKIEGVY